MTPIKYYATENTAGNSKLLLYSPPPGLGFYGGGQNIGRFLCEQDRLISDDTFLNIQVS